MGICIGIGFSWLVLSMNEPLLQLMLVQQGAGPSLLGTIMGIAAVASVAVTFPGSWLVNRLGTRTIIIVSSLLCALAFFLFTRKVDAVMATVLLSMVESGKVLIFLAAQTHIANAAKGDSASDFGWYGAAASIGQIGGPIIGGYLLEASGGFSTPWLVMAILCSAIAFSYFILIDQGTIPQVKKTTKSKTGNVLNMESWVAIAASFAVLFAIGARGNFYALFLNSVPYTPTMIGFLLAVRPLAALASRLFMKPYIALLGGNDQALAKSLVFLAIGIGITPLLPDVWAQVATGILTGIGIGIALPLSMSSVTSSVAIENRSYALGIRLTGNKVAQMTNPLLFGKIGESAGIPAAFYSAGGILLLTSLPAFLYARYKAKQAAQPAS